MGTGFGKVAYTSYKITVASSHISHSCNNKLVQKSQCALFHNDCLCILNCHEIVQFVLLPWYYEQQLIVLWFCDHNSEGCVRNINILMTLPRLSRLLLMLFIIQSLPPFEPEFSEPATSMRLRVSSVVWMEGGREEEADYTVPCTYMLLDVQNINVV